MLLQAHPTIIEELQSSLPTAALAAKLNLVEMEQSVDLLAKRVERMQQEASRCATCGDTRPAVRTLRLLSSLAAVSESSAASNGIRKDATLDNSQSKILHTSANAREPGFGNETSFGIQLETFADSALPVLDNLRAELRATSENYRKLMQYLGEVPADAYRCRRTHAHQHLQVRRCLHRLLHPSAGQTGFCTRHQDRPRADEHLRLPPHPSCLGQSTFLTEIARLLRS